jgi:Tfp pilus assembly protein PilN
MSIRNIRLNLLPPEFKPAPPVTGFSIFFGIIIGVTIAFILVSIILTQGRISKLKDSIENKKGQLASMQEPLKRYDQLMAIMLDTRKRKEMFAYLDNYYVDWAEFISNLSPLLPEKVWLAEIASETAKGGGNAGTVRIVGRTLDNTVLPISFFMRNLDASPYFSDVTFEATSLQFITDKPIQEFSVSVKVKSSRSYTPKVKPKTDDKSSKDKSKSKDTKKDDKAAANKEGT